MNDRTTARWTGAAYLGLAVAGMLGHLLLRSQLEVVGDPAATLARLEAQPVLAQLHLVLELVIVASQAGAALGFFALFRRDHLTAAFGVAGFGLANAAAIMTSAAVLAAANAVAADPALAPSGDAAATVGLLFTISTGAWNAGAVFFGLWLIPMGVYILRTRRMPLVLGWLLVVGGVGYVVSALLMPVEALAAVGEALAYLATIGELWMIGYLLVFGIRPASVVIAEASTAEAVVR